jgi:zinc protease
MNTQRFRCVIFVGLLLSAISLPAQILVRPSTNQSKFIQGKLQNGLQYFILNTPQIDQKVEARLVVKAGFADEVCTQNQVAHLMEHMPFTGTKNFPNPLTYFQNLGMIRGRDINASTEQFNTDYFLTAPNNNSAVVDALRFLKDVLENMAFDSVKVENEKNVLLGEARLSASYANRMERAIQTGSECGIHSANCREIDESKIEALRPSHLQHFYQTLYLPETSAIIMVGNINLEQVEQQIISIFGSKRHSSSSPKPPSLKQSNSDSCSLTVFQSPELPDDRLRFYFEDTTVVKEAYQVYKANLIRTLLNYLIENRLQRTADDKHSITKILGSYYQPDGVVFGRKFNGLIVTALNSSSQLSEDIKNSVTFLAQVAKYGFTESEFNIVIPKAHEFAAKMLHQNPKEYVLEIRRAFLNNTDVSLTSDTLSWNKTAFNEVTRDSFNTWVKRLINFNLVKVVFMQKTDNTQEFNLKDISTRIQEVLHSEIPEMPEDHRPAVELMKPSALSDLDSIATASRLITTRIENLNITKLTLPNGVEAYLKPSKNDFSHGALYFYAVSAGGTFSYIDSDFHAAYFAGDFFTQSNLTPSLKDLARLRHSLGITIQPFLSEYSANLFGVCQTPNTDIMLQAAHLYFSNPKINASILDSIKENIKRNVSKIDNSPYSKLNNHLNDVINVGQLRRLSPSIQSINLVNPLRSVAIFQERFCSINNFKLVFTGDFDVQKLSHLIMKYFGSLPSQPHRRTLTAYMTKINRQKMNEKYFEGESDSQSIVQFRISGDYTVSLENETNMEALQLYMRENLTRILREENGLTYSVSTDVSTNRFSGDYLLMIQFMCAPSEVDHAVSLVRDELEKEKSRLISSDQLARVKTLLEAKLLEDISNPERWCDYLAKQLLQDRPLDEMLSKKDIIHGLTSKTIRDACNRIILSNSIQNFVLMPERR